MENQEKIIKEIVNEWFYEEPLLFSVYCTHSLVQNDALSVPFRTGQFRIEYSPKTISNLSKKQIADYLKVEIYRILLLHPYKRQPYNCHKGILVLASDVTINQFFKTNVKTDFEDINVSSIILEGVDYLKNQAVRFATLEHPLGIKWTGSEELKFFQRNLHINPKSGALTTIDNLSFEDWYNRILFLITQTAIAGSSNVGKTDSSVFFDNSSDELSDLWEEDTEAQNQIKDEIQKAEAEQGWGGLGGNIVREIKSNCDFSFDYRKALSQFREGIISAKRSLTRMRPSRRYDFNAMGSRYERKAKLLIAVDVSGSITDESFEKFYHAVKNIFFLGIIERIEVIFFDVKIKNSKPVLFTKKVNLNQIKGRGGTNFQPPVDFFIEHSSDYSGLIIFTDAQGDIPNLKGNTRNILWIIDNRINFLKSSQWIKKLRNCNATYLP